MEKGAGEGGGGGACATDPDQQGPRNCAPPRFIVALQVSAPVSTVSSMPTADRDDARYFQKQKIEEGKRRGIYK